MTNRTVDDWLSDIVQWGERLQGHLDGIDRDAFLANRMIQDAASKCAEAIGEAAGRIDELDPGLDGSVPGFHLKLARKSRDRLSHGYFRVDGPILWVTVSESIPKIVAAAKQVQRSRQT